MKIAELKQKGQELEQRVSKLAEPEGEWKTINGRHVLVGKGETPLEALNKSLKDVKSGSPITTDKKPYSHPPSLDGKYSAVWVRQTYGSRSSGFGRISTNYWTITARVAGSEDKIKNILRGKSLEETQQRYKRITGKNWEPFGGE